ncbi:hypothetical protein RB600_004306 [Gaeumannomyces tritici]
MMSAGAEVGVAPKRRAAATYGRNKPRNGLSSAAESAASSSRDTAASQPENTKPRTHDRNAPARTASSAQSKETEKSQETARKNASGVQAKLSSSGFVVGAGKETETAKMAQDPKLPMKRKSTQQPVARLPKKQRSSSPDPYAFPGDLEDERPKATREKTAPLGTKKRPARLSPPGVSSSSAPTPAITAAPAKTPRKSVPVRPPRKLKPPPTEPPIAVSGAPEPVAAEESMDRMKDGPMRRSSPEKRSQPLVVQEAIAKEVVTRRRSPEKMQVEPPPATDAVPPPKVSVARVASTDRPTAMLPTRRKLAPSDGEQGTKVPPVKRRPRLIDALTAQAEQSPSSSSSSSESEDESDVEQTPASSCPQGIETPNDMGGSGYGSTPASETPRPRTFARQVSMPRKPGLKYTYSQQRTMLADDFMSGLDSDKAEEMALSQPLLEVPSLAKDSAFDFDDGLVEDASTSGAVRSLHELRKAGANNRTTDEMNDILDRVGVPTAKPSAGRRDALLEMAQKSQQKTFRRQFSDHHNATPTLLKGIGGETDPIAGYLMAAVLLIFLESATSSNLTRQLPFEDLAQLIDLLLSLDTDIAVLAKERKSNMSKFAQRDLAGVKSCLLQLKIWDGAQLTALPPRTLALKCLHLIMQQSMVEDLGDLFSTSVTAKVFGCLESAAENRTSQSWDFPKQPESLDLFLALSLLHKYSVFAMQTSAGAVWNKKHLPVVARILETSMTHRPEQLGELEMLVLKLTLNTANNNQAALSLFLEKSILLELARGACSAFDEVMQALAAGSFVRTVLEALVLILGVMINLSEHGESAGRTLDGSEALDRFTDFFLRYRSRTAEADSEEKTHINVAFGYLSVLLGYLCHYDPIRKRFEALNPGSGLEPLMNSIQEFAVLHEKNEAAAAESTGAEDGNGGSSRRLRALADRLARLRR